MSVVIREITTADLQTDLSAAIDAVDEAHANVAWKCCTTTNLLLPSPDEITRVVNEQIERAVVVEDDGQTVGFTLMRTDGRLRWLILEPTRVDELAPLLFAWLVDNIGGTVWGIVEGETPQLATLVARADVAVDLQEVVSGVQLTTIRWAP